MAREEKSTTSFIPGSLTFLRPASARTDPWCPCGAQVALNFVLCSEQSKIAEYSFCAAGIESAPDTISSLSMEGNMM